MHNLNFGGKNVRSRRQIATMSVFTPLSYSKVGYQSNHDNSPERQSIKLGLIKNQLKIFIEYLPVYVHKR